MYSKKFNGRLDFWKFLLTTKKKKFFVSYDMNDWPDGNFIIACKESKDSKVVLTKFKDGCIDTIINF